MDMIVLFAQFFCGKNQPLSSDVLVISPMGLQSPWLAPAYWSESWTQQSNNP